MYLKKDIDILLFFKSVDRCSGDVILITTEKDMLNLRSQLCRFVFAAASREESFFENATVSCQIDADYKKLQDFLTE